MATFTSLPFELRSQIFALAKPTSITIHIREDADLIITAISSPPALLTSTKESRAAAQKWDLKPYAVLTGDDYQNILFDQDTCLHLIITPSTAEYPAITWTELYTVLGDALLDAKKVEIECSKPLRLARLFMLPENEFVGVGQSCVEAELFGSEIISSDRDTREALRRDISVCVGDEEWVLREEVVEGFGLEASFETKAFFRVDEGAEASALYFQAAKVEMEVDVQASALYFQDAEVEKWSGEELTEDALDRLRDEMGVLFPATVYTVKSDPGGSVMPELDWF
ncbi:uncharacterized protein EKO05_0003527 [Ascochyta rabiei]|uniref:Uncharacterized protein n=1 Tax=Didymella rabiei TaxID=5454 RepID=A0A163GGE9_DIDRA|nr:uncharacterized protein EKO05_0003527 [Ascochyta rabiei]KZM24845.1 hypothetical protein ST47_g4021 [Ascochyta rabiei]UPX12997.1 hypothetical protein EKO05_0003527 [Ascochyta rabiei]